MRELWSLFKTHPIINALALIILGTGYGVGIPMMLNPTPHNGFSIVIMTTVIVCGILLYDYVGLKNLGRKALPKGRIKLVIFYISIILIVIGFIGIVTQMNFKSEPSATIQTTQSIKNVTTSKTQTFIDLSKVDPAQEITFSLGENGISMGYILADLENGTKTAANLGGVTFNVYVTNGKFYVDTSLYDVGGSPIIIKGNEFLVKPSNWDKNYDANALEVVNQSGDAIFQLIYESQYHIVINGIFLLPNGQIVQASNSGSIRLQLFSKCSFNPMSVIGYDVG